MRDLSGRQLGQYELRGIIRRGGMSAVYQAYQPSLHRLVAVKVLAFPGDPEFVARFEREARAIAALQHPNVVRVYDYGEQDGQAYLVMQYVEDGVTLVDLLREPQAPIRCLELMEHVLAGLAYAHGRGIVHRDVKPSNILLASPTWPMLADFGVAKLLAEESLQLTATGVVAGTPAYMAPEQAFRLPVDARTDLYAAGVVLYEMLTGRVPFDAGTPVATLMLHAYEPPPPPRELNPALPEELAALLLKALRKDPAERYQSADEMGAAVQAARLLLERPSRRLAALTPPGSEPRAASHHAAHGAPAVAGQLAGQPAGSGTAAAGTPAGPAGPEFGPRSLNHIHGKGLAVFWVRLCKIGTTTSSGFRRPVWPAPDAGQDEPPAPGLPGWVRLVRRSLAGATRCGCARARRAVWVRFARNRFSRDVAWRRIAPQPDPSRRTPRTAGHPPIE